MLLSVVIPARDAAATLPACFDALAGLPAPHELILVDDGSRDATGRVAEEAGARVVRHPVPRGPAAARNTGAGAASGDLLLFLDADVRVHADTIERIVERFERDAELAALFGSYDDSPPERAFVSRFKNLFHHFVHQQADGPACTFWGACGAVRRRVFEGVGGFNEDYRRPSIEDIELGHRLHAAGYKIHLDKDIQVTHLKRWTLRSVISTDIAQRAVPWGRLLLREGHLPASLNLTWSHRLSVAVAWVGCLATALAPVLLPRGTAIGAVVGTWGFVALSLILLNSGLYRFFARREGTLFALRALPLHVLYCLYSGAALVWAALTRSSAPQLAGSLPRRGTAPGDPSQRFPVERSVSGGPTRIT